MSLAQFTNNATTTLAGPITSTATSLSVTGGTGALFPALTGAQYFRATIMHITSGVVSSLEIVKVTARATDTFTIVRGQEGTTAAAWAAGDTIALLPTAGDMGGFAQFDDLQAQSTNYAPDTGAANAYAVTLTPALTAHVVGMPIRWLAGHANTGASTFNDGVGSASLVYPDGSALASGTISSGGLYTATWDGAKFQLGYPDLSAYATVAMLSSYATTAYVVGNFAPINSPTFTGTPAGPTAATGTSTTEFATTAFVNPGSSITTNGYRKNPDGSIDQWGFVNFSGSSPQSVVFPIAFPTAVLNIAVMPTGPGSGAGPAVESFGVESVSPAPSTTGFTLNSGAGMAFYWRALGH